MNTNLVEKFPEQKHNNQLQTRYGIFIMANHLQKNCNAIFMLLNLVVHNTDDKKYYGNL